MTNNPDPVRPLEVLEVEAARKRIAATCIRTPLVRLELGPAKPDIWLKLENLQPTNAYKLRGAANAVALLPAGRRAKGVWTISAGNAGQGVAYAARRAGVPCTVVAIETAPKAKLERMRALGADLALVSYDRAWEALEARSFPGMDGAFIHPFDDHDFIAGHATLALEVLEDLPNVSTIVCGVGGGGLLAAVGGAMKALRPETKVWGAEPETASPLALSRRLGSPQPFPEWRASFVDGAGGKSMFPRMWERLKPVVDGAAVVTLEQTRAAVRLMAETARVVSEGAGALALAAALTGELGDGPIVCVVSGGNIDLTTLCQILQERS